MSWKGDLSLNLCECQVFGGVFQCSLNAFLWAVHAHFQSCNGAGTETATGIKVVSLLQQWFVPRSYFILFCSWPGTAECAHYRRAIFGHP